MSHFFVVLWAWIASHKLVAACIAGSLASLLAYVIHLPKVQAWLVRFPIAFVVVNFIGRRLLAVAAAGLPGDVVKMLAAAWSGQAPTSPALPHAPLTIAEATSVIDTITKGKGT